MVARWLPLVLVAGVPLALAIGASCTVLPGETGLTNGFKEKDHEAYFPIGEGASHQIGKIVDGGPTTEPISCGGCHNGGETFKEFFCLNCHGPDEAGLANLDNKHGLIDAFVADNLQCLACHPDGRPGTQIGPPPPPPTDGGPEYDAGPVFDHNVEAFPYANGTPHSPEPGNDYMARANTQGLSHCAACHASGDDRTLTRCNSCHEADDPPTSSHHTGNHLLPEFNASTDCKECHWTTPLPPSLEMDTHDALSCATQHYSASCFDCHDDTQKQGQPKEWAFDFSMPAEPYQCAECHADARAYPTPCP